MVGKYPPAEPGELSFWFRPQFPNGMVSSVSFVSTTNTARSLAGCVLLALALTPNSHSAGTSAGAPLSLIKTTRNFAGWVPLAFRSMT